MLLKLGTTPSQRAEEWFFRGGCTALLPPRPACLPTAASNACGQLCATHVLACRLMLRGWAAGRDKEPGASAAAPPEGEFALRYLGRFGVAQI
jgi:hypothetical protein